MQGRRANGDSDGKAAGTLLRRELRRLTKKLLRFGMCTLVSGGDDGAQPHCLHLVIEGAEGGGPPPGLDQGGECCLPVS